MARERKTAVLFFNEYENMTDSEKTPRFGPPEPPTNLKQALGRFIGRDVVIEGTFPIPHGQGVAYAPARGRLTATYEGGFDLMEAGDHEPTVYLCANVRSVHPVSNITKPGTN
jgi:hypothetical protein